MPLDSRIVEWIEPHDTDHFMECDALGIELEYENCRFNDLIHNMNYWVTESDGSLRNRGVELVSSPLRYPRVEAALQEAEAVVVSTGAEATDRCGLHVHMNMKPYSIGQVWSLACLYALIEPSIYQLYAPGREGSMFAVPLWSNTTQTNALYRDMCAIRSFPLNRCMPTLSNTSKYSALNFQSLRSFGTLEMRQPYCSVNFRAIRSWVQFCMRLTEIGVSYTDPLEVLAEYEEHGLLPLQRRMFGRTVRIALDLQELAEDAAYMSAGVIEPMWQELEWESTICAVS